MDLPDIKLKTKKIVCPIGPPNILVRCADGLVESYREILASCTPYFRRIPSAASVIRIGDVPVAGFAPIIKYHQTGECTLKRKNLEMVLRCAQKFGFKEIQNAVKDIMEGEEPGVYTIEELEPGRSSRNVSQAKSSRNARENMEQEGSEVLNEAKEPVYIISGTPSEDPADELLEDDNFDDVSDSGADYGMDLTLAPAIPVGYADGAGSSSHPKRRPKQKWSDSEEESLKKIWPKYINNNGRLDLRGIAMAMQTKGFNRTPVQIRQKILGLAEGKKIHRGKSFQLSLAL